jgi:hypothetical protein
MRILQAHIVFQLSVHRIAAESYIRERLSLVSCPTHASYLAPAVAKHGTAGPGKYHPNGRPSAPSEKDRILDVLISTIERMI